MGSCTNEIVETRAVELLYGRRILRAIVQMSLKGVRMLKAMVKLSSRLPVVLNQDVGNP